MIPFTAAKLGAVQGSVIVVVRGRRGAGSWKLGSSACAKTSHGAKLQIACEDGAHRLRLLGQPLGDALFQAAAHGRRTMMRGGANRNRSRRDKPRYPVRGKFKRGQPQ